MTSPSPGQIARYLKNAYYPDDEAYLNALADTMKREYPPSSLPALCSSSIVRTSRCRATPSIRASAWPTTAR